MNIINKLLYKNYQNFLIFLKWIFISTCIGIIGGGAGTFFAKSITFATHFRESHDFMIFLLPVAGILSVLIYKLFKNENDTGTNAILLAANGKNTVSIKLTLQIIAASFLSHICGASVGREGAALQIGGSIGSFFGRRLIPKEEDKNIIVMCGMSAVFAAVFGTPLAAAVFAMEVVRVGYMTYFAIVPCTCAALVSSRIALAFNIRPDTFPLHNPIDFNIPNALKVFLISILCAVLSVLFITAIRTFGKYFAKYFKNKILRIFIGGIIIVLLTLLIGSRNYNGAGMEVIMEALSGNALPWAFALKILFTAVSIGCGFKGGEIVPSFFIGATFGCVMGQLLGISPGLCAAVGMLAVFCGATNCPLTSLFIGFELFGFENMPFFFIATSVSFALSGEISLYEEQKLAFDKLTGKTIIKNID